MSNSVLSPAGAPPLSALLAVIGLMCGCAGERSAAESESSVEALDVRARHPDAGAASARRAPGLQLIRLGEESMHRLVMTRDAQGKLRSSCSSSTDAPDSESSER